MTTTSGPVADLAATVAKDCAPAFALIDWAEDEIEAAAARHPDAADRLYHAFMLLRSPSPEIAAQEFIYRGHCRELLERVAGGYDTRPGTAAEVVLCCSHISLKVPLNTAAAGLYVRMWGQAFPDKAEMANGVHYEALEGSQIDDLENETRRKLTVPSRQTGKIVCGGNHHGDPAQDCCYAALDTAA